MPRAAGSATGAKMENLVSCLMPTRDRRPLIPLAIHCFQNQEWDNKELLILDDGEDKIPDLIPDDPRIRYMPLPGPPRTIGAKLNILIQQAQGTICTNWDDDDWSAPTRIEDQAIRLLASARQVTGYDSINYWDHLTRTAHRYAWPRSSTYMLGTSQTYFRAWGTRHPYQPITRGMDTAFSTEAAQAHQSTSAPAGPHMVARYHALSKWGNPSAFYSYPIISTTQLPIQFFEDLKTCHQS